MKQLRKFVDNMPWREDKVTLVLVSNGNATFACDLVGKQMLAEAYKEGDVVVAAWTGKYTTHIFGFPVDQLKSLLAPQPA